MSGPIPPPQAAALQPGYFGAAAPPRPSRSIVRCGKAAAARAQNAPRSFPMHVPNSPRRQINFSPRLPVLPQGFLVRECPPKSVNYVNGEEALRGKAKCPKLSRSALLPLDQENSSRNRRFYPCGVYEASRIQMNAQIQWI